MMGFAIGVDYVLDLSVERSIHAHFPAVSAGRPSTGRPSL